MSYKMGPAGGLGGDPFQAPLPAGDFKIVEVRGRSGSRINQIQIVWEKQSDNEPDLSAPFGKDGGTPFTFPIGKEDNYLTRILGSLVDHNSLRVSSLQFFTSSGEFSREFGTYQAAFPFHFECPPNYCITGILGRAEDELDALGVYIDPIPS